MKRWILGVALFLLIAAPAPAGTVARITPGGQVLDRFNVGASPTSVIVGPNNTVWVAARDAKQLVWFDATSPVPTAHPVSTGSGNCGPVGLATDGNRVYFTLP